MSQSIAPFTLSAPGFYGLNLQDSPVEMSDKFALEASNCIIDKSGKIACRKGWIKSSLTNTDLGTNNITCMGELVQNDGTTTTLAAGGGFLFKLVGTTLTTLTYGGGGTPPVISANNWQFVSLNGIGMFFQRGYDTLIYDPVVSTTTFRRVSEKAGYSGAIPLANAAVSAYGRIWCADTSTDKNTVSWSDVKTTHIWTGGTSGTLDLIGVWPTGGDEIIALAAHNNFLFIFGKKQTLIYSGANTPSTMALSDTLNNIGCIARDSIQNTGDDIIFLSQTGVRSLMRTIQEKSAPLRELSKNIRDELQSHINSESLENVKSIYSPIDAFYLITMPATLEVYCFDMRSALPDGSARTTNWYMVTPTAFLFTKSRKLYMGKSGFIGEYSGYLDDTSSYRMTYNSTWIDFGNPIQTSILKKILATIIGTTNQTIIFKWAYDFVSAFSSQTSIINSTGVISEYGIAEYGIAEYGGLNTVNVLTVNPGGSGRNVQLGFETQINGYLVSIQKIDIFTKNGRY